MFKTFRQLLMQIVNRRKISVLQLTSWIFNLKGWFDVNVHGICLSIDFTGCESKEGSPDPAQRSHMFTSTGMSYRSNFCQLNLVVFGRQVIVQLCQGGIMYEIGGLRNKVCIKFFPFKNKNNEEDYSLKLFLNSNYIKALPVAAFSQIYSNIAPIQFIWF